jgi:circadian clock protein KaiB
VYVVEGYQSCQAALRNLTDLCERYFPGRYSIDIIDIGADVAAAVRDNVLAVPTVVRVEPLPPLKIVGDLSDRETCRRLLGIGDGD